MTMPSDAADAVPSNGSNDGPRDSSHEEERGAVVDEQNVPHPDAD